MIKARINRTHHNNTAIFSIQIKSLRATPNSHWLLLDKPRQSQNNHLGIHQSAACRLPQGCQSTYSPRHSPARERTSGCTISAALPADCPNRLSNLFRRSAAAISRNRFFNPDYLCRNFLGNIPYSNLLSAMRTIYYLHENQLQNTYSPSELSPPALPQ